MTVELHRTDRKVWTRVPDFWILPLYRELLNSARRNRPSAASERAQGCTGLVIICKENKEQRGKRKFHEGVSHPTIEEALPSVWVVQLDQHAICVVSSKLGANGGRAVLWFVVHSRGVFLCSAWTACFRAFPETVRRASLAPI